MKVLDVLSAQLAAMRAQLEVLAAVVEEARAEEASAVDLRTIADVCPHPPQLLEDAGSTFALSRKRCLACGEVLTVDRSNPAEDRTADQAISGTADSAGAVDTAVASG